MAGSATNSEKGIKMRGGKHLLEKKLEFKRTDTRKNQNICNFDVAIIKLLIWMAFSCMFLYVSATQANHSDEALIMRGGERHLTNLIQITRTDDRR